MVTTVETPLHSQPLTRRELRELERAAEREALQKEREALQKQLRERTVQPAVAQTIETVESASAAEPEQFMTRRERREAERRQEAELRREAVAAAQSAVESNPECFAPVDEAESVVVPEPVAEQVVDTLDPTTEPIVLAPVVSLDEVRAAREREIAESSVSTETELEQAPADEPEIDHAFYAHPAPASPTASEMTRARARIESSRGTGRFSGSMVAMSLLAGTIALGAGSATAISALAGNAEEPRAQQTDAGASSQSFSVDGEATTAEDGQAHRGGDTTAVQAIGSAAAANLAAGVKMPDSATFTNNMTANVQYPFPMGVTITDQYGLRDAPAGASSYHGGVDFTPGEGTPIGVIADGIVTKVDESNGSSFGIFVEVQHEINGELVTTLYAHLQPGSVAVAEGDVVAVGDEIGKVGNTGISTGPHLHLEVHIGTKYVDPMYFLSKMNVDGVAVEVPSFTAPDVSTGGNEKLSHEASTALVDELAASNGQ